MAATLSAHECTHSHNGGLPALLVHSLRECHRLGPGSSDNSLEKQGQSVRQQWRSAVGGRLLERTSAADLSLFDRTAKLWNAGRKAASDGNVGEACKLFAIGGSLVTRESGARDETRLLCTAIGAAAEAYLDCGCNDYAQALGKLRESYDAAAALDARFGYDMMRNHQIHLLNNVMRVEALAGGYAAALGLSAQVLIYLTGERRDTVDYGWCLPALPSRELDSANLLFLASQTIHELALITAMMDPACRRIALNVLNEQRVREAMTQWQPLVAWFELKRGFLACSDSLNYLSRAHEFLADGSGHGSPLLWFTAAMDASLVCESLPGGAGFCSEVLDGPHSRYLPNLVPKSRLHVAGRRPC